jgi:hypothetical protein
VRISTSTAVEEVGGGGWRETGGGWRSGGAVKQWGHRFSRERSRREAGGRRWDRRQQGG